MDKLTQDESKYLEGYAAALQDILRRITGENTCGKSYDPMMIDCDGTIMRSYAFNLNDGGRKHFVSDYESIDEICSTLKEETFAAIAWEADVAIPTLKSKEAEMIKAESAQ